MQRAFKAIATGAGIVAAGYGAYAGYQWHRYGRKQEVWDPAEEDLFLDRFLPGYEVVTRHKIRIQAPPAKVIAAVRDMDLASSPAVKAIFKAREFVMCAHAEHRDTKPGLVAMLQELGWSILAEVDGREIVLGAVTRPWEPKVQFRPMSPDAFAAFRDPGYVKIAFTLRADPEGLDASLFRTETRAAATDAEARIKFRRYWALLSPGIDLIRVFALPALKREVERRPESEVRLPSVASFASAR